MNRAQIIDHTLLKADASKTEITQLCIEAIELEMGAVCINPKWVKTASEILADSQVKVCTVVGFPLGAATSESKAFETRQAVANGAAEIDMVIDLGAVKDGDWEHVEADIAAVVRASANNLVKVILETCLLTDAEIVKACKVAVAAGADYVKTSTGFSSAGATVHAVQLMRESVGSDFGVKAAGGIRTYQDYDEMVAAGASRIGSSAGKVLLGE
ncbi:deoxyribose-phosphate aldolase [Arcanobacterium hippocoleae]